jgi:transposase-like protein
MTIFPITELLSEVECYQFLLEVFHPGGMCCPKGHFLPEEQCPHRRLRGHVADYRCRTCGSVFNVYTGTLWAGTHYSCATVLLVLRGFAQGVPTRHLAQELGCDYGTLLGHRHAMQAALQRRNGAPLEDAVVEGDEMFQNAGEKGRPHLDPADPPRTRANQRRGAGTLEHDRPPVQGVVGRASGQVRLTVCDNTQQDTVQPEVEAKTLEGAVFNSDESTAYGRVAKSGRGHSTVCQSRREWARDDDGDGIREVHCNTMEGIWTGLRNFLRPFRGVNKAYLAQYVAMFEWAHNLKRLTARFIWMMVTPVFTYLPK